MVTVNWPLTVAGAGETALQADGGVRLVADCKANPSAFVGQVRTAFVPETPRVNSGGRNRLNTVPLPPVPPTCASPYSVLLDKIPDTGPAPSLFVVPTSRLKS